MIDRFKEFLAGSPNWMDESQVESWAYQVAVVLPRALGKWHDPDFGSDVWSKDGGYYETARKKLAALGGFTKNCPNAGEVLQALKLLVQFFEDEKRKAGLGKTTRKPVVTTPTLPKVAVLEEGAIRDMHISLRERNADLRIACIEHYRQLNGGEIVCLACGLSFGKVYGKIGEGYIEVHHLSPISQTEGVHAVDPKTDLVPLCANCHAMIHRLMSAEKKQTGNDLEGAAALEALRNVIKEHQHA